jgi:hypothetical protein
MVTPICDLCRRPDYSGGSCSISAHCKRQPKLNLGCGISPKEQYINFDAFIYSGIQGWDKHLQTDIQGKIEDILEIFPHEYFQEIMSSHVIEHFYLEDAIVFLERQLKLLRPGGKIIVEGPCVLGIYRWYLEDRAGPKDPNGIRFLIESLYPYQNRLEYSELMAHKSGWTGEVLSKEMEKLGFKIIHVGEGQTHGTAWHDFRVEGVKL